MASTSVFAPPGKFSLRSTGNKGPIFQRQFVNTSLRSSESDLTTPPLDIPNEHDIIGENRDPFDSDESGAEGSGSTELNHEAMVHHDSDLDSHDQSVTNDLNGPDSPEYSTQDKENEDVNKVNINGATAELTQHEEDSSNENGEQNFTNSETGVNTPKDGTPNGEQDNRIHDDANEKIELSSEEIVHEDKSVKDEPETPNIMIIPLNTLPAMHTQHSQSDDEEPERDAPQTDPIHLPENNVNNSNESLPSENDEENQPSENNDIQPNDENQPSEYSDLQLNDENQSSANEDHVPETDIENQQSEFADENKSPEQNNPVIVPKALFSELIAVTNKKKGINIEDSTPAVNTQGESSKTASDENLDAEIVEMVKRNSDVDTNDEESKNKDEIKAGLTVYPKSEIEDKVLDNVEDVIQTYLPQEAQAKPSVDKVNDAESSETSGIILNQPQFQKKIEIKDTQNGEFFYLRQAYNKDFKVKKDEENIDVIPQNGDPKKSLDKVSRIEDTSVHRNADVAIRKASTPGEVATNILLHGSIGVSPSAATSKMHLNGYADESPKFVRQSNAFGTDRGNNSLNSKLYGRSKGHNSSALARIFGNSSTTAYAKNDKRRKEGKKKKVPTATLR